MFWSLALTLFLGYCFLAMASSDICDRKVCEFTLVVHHTRTMIYHHSTRGAYDVKLRRDQLQLVENTLKKKPDELIGRNVTAAEVITADGYPRNIITINGEFPGPTLEVLEGAQVVVNVVNNLRTSGVTIHWHGLSQKMTPWMDGVPFITQCPIHPSQSFTYRFRAQPSGTHWYHSHLASQRLDGLSGAFIVHERKPSMPYFVVSVTDWFPWEARTLDAATPFQKEVEYQGTGDLFFLAHADRGYSADAVETTAVTYHSALINGRGRWNDEPFPLTVFTIQKDRTYRFRTVNSAAEFAFEISIDDHHLVVVALDGCEIVPMEVHAVIIFPGERVDFEVKGKGTAGHIYWFRARTLRIGSGGGKVPNPKEDDIVQETKAVVSYGDFLEGNGLEPTSLYMNCTSATPCHILNCPYESYPKHRNRVCRDIDEARALRGTESIETFPGDTESEIDFSELFFNIGFNWGSSINARRFLDPAAPLYQNPSGARPCDTACSDDKTGCFCTHTIKIPFNKTIQMVLTNYHHDDPYVGHHPMHIHGHSFAVLKIGFPPVNLTTGRILRPNGDVNCTGQLCLDAHWANGRPNLNLENPPIKDTVVVPALGYVVIRFRSDNPGLWLLHCHAETHMEEGMVLLLDEGSGRYPPPPAGFPTCRNFAWSADEYKTYMEQSETYLRGLGDIWRETNENNDNCASGAIDFLLRLCDILGLFLGRLFLGGLVSVSPFILFIRFLKKPTKRT